MKRITNYQLPITKLKFTYIFAFIVLMVIAAVVVLHNRQKDSDDTIPVTIGPVTIQAEQARTDAQKELGLGGRASMPNDHGMIFYFNPPQVVTFWMKGMQFPLDFIWVRDHKVTELTEHVGAPLASMTDDQLPRYTPKEYVDAVVEVNAGFVEFYKIRVGDSLKGY